MRRIRCAPRTDAARSLESQGLSFHGVDDYWNEKAFYQFTSDQIDVLESATETLHAMCLQAVRHVVHRMDFARLGIPRRFWEKIVESFEEEDFSLYGRLDLAYDGSSPPKLLEYNADTPTSVLESAVCQWYWLADVFPDADQFNALHEKLVGRWRALGGSGAVHFASLRDNEEDWVSGAYLMDTAEQAGREVRWIAIEDIGWDSARSRFVDEDRNPIETMFKLYPWEWIFREDFGRHVLGNGTMFIEPPWKAILSCKGLLPVLWELFPGHELLLPAYFQPGRLDAYARKPLYSREGANVELVRGGTVLAKQEGPYGTQACIEQALHPLACFDGHYAVIGSWLVGGQAAGICIREDASPITTDQSRFVPHIIEPGASNGGDPYHAALAGSGG